MTQNSKQRKLKAIFSAVVLGYSKMMDGEDEYTVNTITTLREVFDDLIEKHHVLVMRIGRV